MGLLIAVDPGLRRPSASVWRDGVLLGARSVPEATGRSPAQAALALRLRVVDVDPAAFGPDVEIVEEWPRLYPTRRASHADVIALRDMLAFFAVQSGVRKRAKLSPSAWKGNAPKGVIERRLRAAFPVEFAAGLIDETHDAIDALGIGAVHLGILAVGCVDRRRA